MSEQLLVKAWKKLLYFTLLFSQEFNQEMQKLVWSRDLRATGKLAKGGVSLCLKDKCCDSFRSVSEQLLLAVPTDSADLETSLWGCKLHTECTSHLSFLLCLYHWSELKFLWQTNLYNTLSTSHCELAATQDKPVFQVQTWMYDWLHTVNHLIWGFGHRLWSQHLTRANDGCKKKKDLKSRKTHRKMKIKAL